MPVLQVDRQPPVQDPPRSLGIGRAYLRRPLEPSGGEHGLEKTELFGRHG